MNTSTIYFKNLDALRFFSFLSVFISHTLIIPATGNSISEFVLNVLLMNYLGVPLFFSLSSFLITYRLLTEKRSTGKVRLWNFYRNRILRIWPAYYIIVILCFIVLPLAANILHSKPPTLPTVWPFLLFYVNFYIVEHGDLFTFALVILWSISIEEQFYFVWGIAMKWITGKMIGILILALFIFSIVFSYNYLQSNPSNKLAIHSIFILQNFCTGACAAFLSLNTISFLSSKKTRKIVFTAPYFILPACYLFTNDFVLLNIIKSICYGMIIYDQSLNEKPFFNAGRSAIINYLGKISYGLYLYHAIVIVILQTQFHFFGSATNQGVWQNILQSLAALTITITISHFSYKYIEAKFLAMKSH